MANSFLFFSARRTIKKLIIMAIGKTKIGTRLFKLQITRSIPPI